MSVRGLREVVLVGAGHAHVQVIRRWMMAPPPGARLSVVLDRAEAVYSGMVPGFVAGQYRAHELEIDAVPLARRAGARVVLAAARRVDPVGRRIELEGRPPLPYDLASLDVGSSVRGLELSGVREHALATRPIRGLVDRLEGVLAAAPRTQGFLRVAVVGGGAAGLELAFTLEARLRRGGERARVSLVFESERLLPGHAERFARQARREAERRGIALHPSVSVLRVEKDALQLADGQTLETDLCVWAAGAAPPPLLAASPLPRDGEGYLRVEDTLQVAGHETLFAAGDCARLDSAAWVPRAGVYAVRQGPVLDANLRARLRGASLRPYRPQRRFLALLNLGEGRALGSRGSLVAGGRAVWRLKDWIDRRFMRRFQVLDADAVPSIHFPSPEAMGADEMACGGCAAKLAAPSLERALERLPAPRADAAVLLGLARPDDAAAVALPGGQVLLASVDGFRAFTDDPFLVGRVAAVNAASDVWAKGGRARQALAWVGLPEGEPEGAEETLFQVLSGIRAAFDPLEISLVGGHTTLADELQVGLAILGELGDASELLPLGGARPGDALLLSKPLGTGVVLAADMRGLAPGAWVQAAWASMLRPNDAAARVVREAGAHACTDVSGFGLAGHLGELLRASGCSAVLRLEQLPALPGAVALLARGLRSTYHAQNARLRERLFAAAAPDPRPVFELLFDPQTSGGLLFALPAERADAALAALDRAGGCGAARIGRIAAARDDGAWLQLEP